MNTVWLREMECDHAPPRGIAIFSTLEKAKASQPQVEWRQWEDGSWSDAAVDIDGFGDCWVIREMPLDPGCSDE